MRRILLSFIGMAAYVLSYASDISQADALHNARLFLQSYKGAQAARGAVGGSAQQQLSLAGREAGFYVFNIGAGDGFVIASGDDRVAPVVGYSDTGSFDPTDMPDNLRSWLQGYADQIAWLDAQGITAKQTTLRKAAIRSAVSPLLTSLWNQGAPYNDQCPTGCVTGCVATAMAQLMYYHKYPTGSSTAIPAYTSDGDAGTIAMDELAPTTFDWSKMYNTYNSGEDGSEVAKLMKYCGQATKMNYGSSSGTDTRYVTEALVSYFGYDEGARYLSRSDYYYSEWIDVVYNELAAGRPVLFSGQSIGGGHAFICDGFSEDDYFHINWGWGGLSNGYFKLSLLSPSEQGAGGSSSTDGYNLSQYIGIGIQPSTGAATDPTLAKLAIYSVDLQESGNERYTRTSASQNFCLVPNMAFSNPTGKTYNFCYGIRLTKDGATVAESVWQDTPVAVSSNGWQGGSATFNFGAGLADGVYKVIGVYKAEGSETWLPCEGAADNYIEVTISGNTMTPRVVTTSVALSVSGITYSSGTTPVVGRGETVTVSVTNAGTAAYHGDITFGLRWDEGSTKYIEKWGGVAVDIEAGATANVVVNFTPTRSGTFNATVYSGTFDNELYQESLTIGAASAIDANISLSNILVNGETNSTYGGTLYGSTITLEFDATNNGTDAYEMGFGAILFKNTSGSSYSSVAEKTDNTVVGAGEQKTIKLEFKDVEYNKYLIQFYYFTFDGATKTQQKAQLPSYNSYQTAAGFVTIDKLGNVTASAPTASVTVPAGAVVVDLRGQNVVTAVTPNANPNTLYLIDSDATVPSGVTKNVVKGTSADAIELTDGYDFYTPIAFQAASMTYKRTIATGASGSKGWTTLCLPFDATQVEAKGAAIDWFHGASDTGKNFWLKRFTSDAIGTVNFDYESGSAVKANTPYIIAVPDATWGAAWNLAGEELTFSGTNVQIGSSVKAVASGNYYKYVGTTSGTAATDFWAIDAEGSNFVKSATGSVEPFRAYFESATVSVSAAFSQLAIGAEGGQTTGVFDLRTATQPGAAAVYDLRGVKVGTSTDNLQKGIYIINGKKVVR